MKTLLIRYTTLMKETSHLVWIDCEFTSLDFDTNTLCEIACVVTDSDLQILGEPYAAVIGMSERKLDRLASDWTRKEFKESGLWDKILESDVSISGAEAGIFKYIKQCVHEGEGVLAGNSVNQDRRMLVKEMPELEAYLHYRTIDISTIKELAKRWKPELLEQVKKEQTHRALDDVYESIEELKVYRSLFK